MPNIVEPSPLTLDPAPFQDAVCKGTFELLPGCASIVLERIVAVQSYVTYQARDKDDEEMVSAMRRLYAAIAHLTQWAGMSRFNL
jgi:hypothetical protein